MPRLRHYLIPVVLIACVLIVGFWEIMARRSTRPFRPFDLTAEDFADFRLPSGPWKIATIPVATNDPVEPNIIAFAATRQGCAVGARLVHGYNMPMCMKIKGYTVELIGQPNNRDSGPLLREGYAKQATNDEPRTTNEQPGTRNQEPGTTNFPHAQVWRLTSSAGDVSIWITSMLRAGDFEVTGTDIRTLAFPRVDIPDDPRWIPRGLTWSSLRHPIAGLRLFLRERWNSSRTDILTFLRLRQPAWASEELLTFVSYNLAPPVSGGREQSVARQVAAVHGVLLEELQRWRRANL